MEEKEKVPEKKKKRKTVSYPNRLLRALEDIYSSEISTVAQKLQAIQLSLEVLPHRVSPRRKTEKEKMVIAALKAKEKKAN